MSETSLVPAPITGFVAQILNSRELVISVGAQQGVAPGTYFDVLDPKGENIKDPVTGKVLGSLSRRKVRVKVTDVRDQLSVASTYRSTKVNVGGTGSSLTNLSDYALSLLPRQWVVKYETLRADDKDWDDLDAADSYVKIGDPVIQFIPPNDEEGPANG